MEPRLKIYMRANRLKWGITQAELAYLLGLKTGSVVSRIERVKRQPGVMVVLACQVIFGTMPIELLPGHFSDIEDAVMRRVHEMDKKFKSKSSPKNKAKQLLLKDIVERAASRHDPKGL
ncbi:MAG TPA: helix-turn-helix transcriptional regulator [Bryobacteraceae bacterium]|nr:helix-turn-helix transcriptional regulator [Bryobacteraceae bacterium]